jgi:hypothetical protein
MPYQSRKQRRLIICRSCHQQGPHEGLGLCRRCYQRKPRKKRATCHPDRPHHTRGLCKNCAYPGRTSDRQERMRRWGITMKDVEEQFQAQKSRCAICCLPMTMQRWAGHGKSGTYTFAVDHDHQTGLMRGLLCRRCNTGLGNFRDDPKILRRAAGYLEDHRAVHHLEKGVTMAG